MDPVSALVLALLITGGWGVYCYMLGRRHGQNDLINDFVEHNIIYIDDEGFVHSGRAAPLPRRDDDNNDSSSPPSAPAT